MSPVGIKLLLSTSGLESLLGGVLNGEILSSTSFLTGSRLFQPACDVGVERPEAGPGLFVRFTAGGTDVVPVPTRGGLFPVRDDLGRSSNDLGDPVRDRD